LLFPIEVLASIFGKSPQEVARELSEKAQDFTGTITIGKVNAVIEELLEIWHKEAGETVYRIELDSN
jgi:hypothetical protein